jgi:hypothetical protein
VTADRIYTIVEASGIQESVPFNDLPANALPANDLPAQAP